MANKSKTSPTGQHVLCLGVCFGYWPCLKAPFVQLKVGIFVFDLWYGLKSYQHKEKKMEEPKVCLVDGSAPSPGYTEIKENGQQVDYLVLCPEERNKGFIRPVRQSYKHTKCGTVTTMGLALAETYARNPYFYAGTFCCGCRKHLPVAEFTWVPDGSVVGS